VKRVLVLRAREDAERTSEKLRAMGFDPLLSPVLEIVATGAAIPQGDYDATLATSAKGVEHVALDDALRAMPLHAVGARTERIAQELGWRVELVAGNAQALLPLLYARYNSPRGSSISPGATVRPIWKTAFARRDMRSSSSRPTPRGRPPRSQRRRATRS